MKEGDAVHRLVVYCSTKLREKMLGLLEKVTSKQSSSNQDVPQLMLYVSELVSTSVYTHAYRDYLVRNHSGNRNKKKLKKTVERTLLPPKKKKTK
jgi:hypothetical protein